MIHWSSMSSGVLPKYVEAMPLLRLMSGSNQDRDIEEGMLASIVTNISEDGLIYDRATETLKSYIRRGHWLVALLGYWKKKKRKSGAQLSALGMMNVLSPTGGGIFNHVATAIIIVRRSKLRWLPSRICCISIASTS